MAFSQWFYDGSHPGPYPPGDYNIITLILTGLVRQITTSFPAPYVTNIGPFGYELFLDVFGAVRDAAIVLPYVYTVSSVNVVGAGVQCLITDIPTGIIYNHIFGAGVAPGVIATITMNANGTYSGVP